MEEWNIAVTMRRSSFLNQGGPNSEIQKSLAFCNIKNFLKLSLYKPVYKNLFLIRENFYLLNLLDTFLGGFFLKAKLKHLSYTFALAFILKSI